MKASIFIPTKNAGPEFGDILKAIFEQDFEDFEVVIIDSGSTDETIKIAHAFNLKIHTIPSEEFGHGKTRNLALKYCSGEYIVFLSQDACPRNKYWLSALIEACMPEKIAGSFSRQIPYEGTAISENFFYTCNFSTKRRIRSLGPDEPVTLSKTFFSNAASCVKRNIFQTFPFHENIIMSEDQEWTKRILEAGYRTAYEPTSQVTHSHFYTLRQTTGRYLDSAYSLNQIFDYQSKRFIKGRTWYLIQELLYVSTHKPFALPYFFLNTAAKTIGTLLGLHAEKLPKKLIEKVSMHSYYWK